MTVRVHLLDDPPRAVLRQVISALDAFNAAAVPDCEDRRVFVVARDAGAVVGGLLGFTFGKYLSIDVMWVEQARRGEGIGAELMRLAEAEAVRRGCRHAHTDTFDFQAPGFYEKLGYVRFATLEQYAGDHARHYYRKPLT